MLKLKSDWVSNLNSFFGIDQSLSVLQYQKIVAGQKVCFRNLLTFVILLVVVSGVVCDRSAHRDL